MVHVERGKLLQAQACLEKAHKLAPGEDYVLRHLQIVQNRIAKMKLNPNEETANYNSKEESKVVSNKSIDETERKTSPVVSEDTEEQRYSSRVVNTEPLFVQNVDNIEYVDSSLIDEVDVKEKNVSKFENKQRSFIGTDGDDPSSGML